MAEREYLAPARRYSEALYDLAREKGEIEAVVNDVVALKGVVDADPALVRTLSDPKVGWHDKKALVESKLLPGRHRLVGNLLQVLLARRREELLGDFFVAFGDTLDRANGVLKVEVETATPLADAARDELARKLGETTGRPVEMAARVRPELLGGMRFIVDSRLIDGSIAARLDRLRQRMLAARA